MNTKTLLLVLLGSMLFTPLSHLMIRPASAAGYTDVTVLEAKTMIDLNPSLVLLDVRNESEYLTGHIRNAKLIPLYDLNNSLSELNVTDEILVYCGLGGRSATASVILAFNGFLHIYNMLGGMAAWTREEYPTYIKYPSIQEAIDNATEGDTIYVSTGLYNEHLSINKSLSLTGENKNTAIIDGTSDGTVLYINADNVSISDFKIQYSGCACAGFYGINIETNHKDINITNNNIFSDSYGILINKTQNANIIRNNITYSREFSISMQDSVGILVSDNDISSNLNQVNVENSTDTTIINNNITHNSVNGIALTNSDENTITGNIITSNTLYGLDILQSNNNTIFHNSFAENLRHVSSRNSTNFYDDGFEGNFWSNYTGTDANHDGIGDTPHVIDSSNRDNHPLVGTFQTFTTPLNYNVDIVSNSTVDNFEYSLSNSTIKIRVSSINATQTSGFCRISIPHGLIDPVNGSILVVIDNGQTPVLFLNDTLYDNGTHRWIYFAYTHSTHEIIIVPEFPKLPMVLLLMVTTILTSATYKRKRTRMHVDVE